MAQHTIGRINGSFAAHPPSRRSGTKSISAPLRSTGTLESSRHAHQVAARFVSHIRPLCQGNWSKRPHARQGGGPERFGAITRRYSTGLHS
jgi:hypothetical protein